MKQNIGIYRPVCVIVSSIPYTQAMYDHNLSIPGPGLQKLKLQVPRIPSTNHNFSWFLRLYTTEITNSSQGTPKTLNPKNNEASGAPSDPAEAASLSELRACSGALNPNHHFKTWGGSCVTDGPAALANRVWHAPSDPTR